MANLDRGNTGWRIFEYMNMQAVDIFEAHADLCRAIANPKRLMIIGQLREKDRSVGELADRIGISQSTTSQHLRVLREKGLVDCRRDAQTTWYSLAAPRIVDACCIVREVLFETMKRRGELAQDIPLQPYPSHPEGAVAAS